MLMGLKSAEFSIQRTVQHQHVNVPEMYQTFFLVNVFNHKTQNQTKSDLTWPDSLSRIRFANGILGLLQAFRTRPYNLVIDWCRALYLCTLMAFLSLAICPLPYWLFRASFHWPNTDQCSDSIVRFKASFLAPSQHDQLLSCDDWIGVGRQFVFLVQLWRSPNKWLSASHSSLEVRRPSYLYLWCFLCQDDDWTFLRHSASVSRGLVGSAKICFNPT